MLLATLLAASLAVAPSNPELHDCTTTRRATLSLRGFGAMREDRVGRFTNLPPLACTDVHVDSVIAFPGRVRRGGKQALELTFYFAEHPPAGKTLNHTLRVELVDRKIKLVEGFAPAWIAAKATRSIVKISLEVGEEKLAELLALPEPPDLEVTLEVRAE